jgi:hypothetical protein
MPPKDVREVDPVRPQLERDSFLTAEKLNRWSFRGICQQVPISPRTREVIVT